ncbi:MAG: M48 family metalloprotease [archaeon]|nr:MAG: M48 family metalloprotease [archaeon]
MIIATIIAIIYVLATYNNSEKIAISSAKAKPADPIRHRGFINAIDNMSIASGMPKPKAYVMPGSRINAFTAGRDPNRAIICVTEGALKKLSKQELEGVVGHEMAHIANYDMRFMTLVAIVVGAIAIFSQIFLRSLWFSGGRRSSGEGGAILMIIAIALAILAPIIVMLVQLSISRKREFMADAGSVSFTRYPPGLVGALKKIGNEMGKEKKLEINRAVSHLLFAPNILSTHPSIKDRIKKLEQM